jgi:[ribosomal protein S18]-alanine N-acetyltransferase
MSITTEPMQRHHVAAVAAIEAASSPSPWSDRLFAGEFDSPAESRTWLVAVDDDTVVGFIGALFVADEAHVMNVAVDPARRRDGVGRRLLAALVAEASNRGVRHLSLEVRPSNTAARRLYQRFGLAPAGVRRRYYPDGEDALVMWAHDIDAAAYQQRVRDLCGAQP